MTSGYHRVPVTLRYLWGSVICTKCATVVSHRACKDELRRQSRSHNNMSGYKSSKAKRALSKGCRVGCSTVKPTGNSSLVPAVEVCQGKVTVCQGVEVLSPDSVDLITDGYIMHVAYRNTRISYGHHEKQEQKTQRTMGTHTTRSL